MIYSAGSKPRSLSEKLLLSDNRLSLRIHQPARQSDISCPAVQDSDTQFDDELATRISLRIETRLPGRIRHLAVFTTENAVILSGDCSTFYTKQVAQHAAMGVLEYEQLINNFEVRSVK